MNANLMAVGATTGMTNAMHYGGGGGQQAFMDNLKNMLLTLTMVKSTNSTGNSGDNLWSMFITILLVSSIDVVMLVIKQTFAACQAYVNQYVTQKTTVIPKLIQTLQTVKKIKATVFIKLEEPGKNLTGDAIIDLLTNLPHTKNVMLCNNNYMINYQEEIEITPELFAIITNSANRHVSNPEMTVDQATTTTSQQPPTQITQRTEVPNGNAAVEKFVEVYSYTLDMDKLREEITRILRLYQIKITNKLGNDIYYFSEIPMMVYSSTGGVDHSKLPPQLHFNMKRFTTNRTFGNLFGCNISKIHKRVDFFKNNKRWYDDKGIPYTLGIMMSGKPGTGKTSLIKCVANELKRHIINIHLSNNMTKQQIENLFFNETVSVTQNGKTEVYIIPIEKRLYVLEDIDCQCDIILERANKKNKEAELIEENQNLRKQIEQLKHALENPNQRIFNANAPAKQEPPSAKSEVITFSFLLNILDGVLETPGRVIIMSSNFIDKLDKALTRPGRIDILSDFGYANSTLMIEMIEHRYDAMLTDEQKNVIIGLPEVITPAEVSRVLFENFDNMDGALVSIKEYAESTHSKMLMYDKADEDQMPVDNKSEDDSEEEKPDFIKVITKNILKTTPASLSKPVTNRDWNANSAWTGAIGQNDSKEIEAYQGGGGSNFLSF